MTPHIISKLPSTAIGLSNSLKARRAFTLVELLIATSLSLLMVLAATTLFVASRAIYLTQDDAIRVQDTARFALEIIGRSVAQAGFIDHGAAHASDGFAASTIAPIAGLDNRSLKSTAPAIHSPVAQTVNGSDVLALHFEGSGTGDEGDGSVTNCAGFSVGRADPAAGRVDRGWSIFYVAKDHTGEPELYCKYRGKNAWATAAIARGVESFQVLYGIGETSDAIPRHFLNASQIDRLDSDSSFAGAIDETRQDGTRGQTHWKKISQIKIALIVRGTQAVRSDQPAQRWNVFGDAYVEAHGDSDPGVHVDEADLPLATRHRLRKLFRADFQLRNGAALSESASTASSTFAPLAPPAT
jgi:type IV pilus assembly protein PilW